MDCLGETHRDELNGGLVVRVLSCHAAAPGSTHALSLRTSCGQNLDGYLKRSIMLAIGITIIRRSELQNKSKQ